MKTLCISIITLSLLSAVAFAAFAQEGPHQPNAASKLANGIGEMAISVVEVPRQIVNTSRQNQKSPLAAPVIGLGKGLAMMVITCGEGAVNAITFALPPYETNVNLFDEPAGGKNDKKTGFSPPWLKDGERNFEKKYW